MHTLISLLHHDAVDFWVTCSVLGYCILPIVFLAAVAIVVGLKNIFGLLLAGVVIAWSTYGATRLVSLRDRMNGLVLMIRFVQIVQREIALDGTVLAGSVPMHAAIQLFRAHHSVLSFSLRLENRK
jgi:Na+/proline symporter